MNERKSESFCKICHKEVELARVEARVDSLEHRAEEIYEGQQHLLEKLDELIEPDEDAISFYFLCESCRSKIERIGGRKPLPDDAIFIGWDEEGL